MRVKLCKLELGHCQKVPITRSGISRLQFIGVGSAWFWVAFGHVTSQRSWFLEVTLAYITDEIRLLSILISRRLCHLYLCTQRQRRWWITHDLNHRLSDWLVLHLLDCYPKLFWWQYLYLSHIPLCQIIIPRRLRQINEILSIALLPHLLRNLLFLGTIIVIKICIGIDIFGTWLWSFLFKITFAKSTWLILNFNIFRYLLCVSWCLTMIFVIQLFKEASQFSAIDQIPREFTMNRRSTATSRRTLKDLNRFAPLVKLVFWNTANFLQEITGASTIVSV